MRTLQIVLLVLGVLALLGAIPFIGSNAGDALWRSGMAALVVDIVIIMLWNRGESTKSTKASKEIHIGDNKILPDRDPDG